MNIFVTSSDPRESARRLDDKRVVKMIVESCQMLSTAMHVQGISNAPYRKTHTNHPCAVWTRTNRSNYRWLLDHTWALAEEYCSRYGRDRHASFIHLLTFERAIHHLPEGEMTPFPNCTPFKGVSDVHRAYRMLMFRKWRNDKVPARITLYN